MTFIDILVLAFALAIDAFAVSFSYGLILKNNRISNTLKLALATGFAQFAMPLFGWFGASLVYRYIETFSHLITFVVFVLLGLNIIYNSLKEKEESEKEKGKDNARLTYKILFVLAMATSIDALFAGATLFFEKVDILFSVIIIGIVAFIGSAIGYNLNICFKKLPVKWLEISAGIILILLGVKSLF